MALLSTLSTRICAPSPATMATATAATAAAAAAAAAAATISPAIIIGAGRLGRALHAMGDGRDLLISRGQQIPLDLPGPIFACTRNDDLDAVLDAIPFSRWNDLVFFQNGMLDPWFERRGIVEANQVLAYFAVSRVGESPVDGRTDMNPEGLSAVFGKWGFAVAARLHRGGLSCKILQKEAFQKQMLEKLIWISAFMLVGARHLGATVGVVEQDYRSEVSSLITELESAAAAEQGITFDDGMVARLCAYSRAVAHFPTAVKEFKWRNGWFYSLTEKAIALGKDDPCPLHTTWLKEIKII